MAFPTQIENVDDSHYTMQYGAATFRLDFASLVGATGAQRAADAEKRLSWVVDVIEPLAPLRDPASPDPTGTTDPNLEIRHHVDGQGQHDVPIDTRNFMRVKLWGVPVVTYIGSGNDNKFTFGWRLASTVFGSA